MGSRGRRTGGRRDDVMPADGAAVGRKGNGGGTVLRWMGGGLGVGVGGRGAEGGLLGPGSVQRSEGSDPRRTATCVGVIWNRNIGGDRGMERGVATGRSSWAGQGVRL